MNDPEESDSQILNSLLEEDIIVPIEKDRVTLCEPNEPESEALIVNLPSDAICVKADSLDVCKIFGETKRGVRKRADYVIISESAKKVLIVELKKNKEAWWHVCSQLHGAQCLTKYFCEIGKTFWKKNNFMEKYEYHFISISHAVVGTGRKTETTARSELDPSVLVKKISHPHYLQYAQLTSKV